MNDEKTEALWAKVFKQIEDTKEWIETIGSNEASEPTFFEEASE